MAEFIFRDMVSKAGVADRFHIASAATSTEEIGSGIHYGARRMLEKKGIPIGWKVAVQMKRSDYKEYDYLIGMDSANIRNMTRIAGGDPEGKIHKLLEFTGSSRDIADPWYTDDFETAYSDIDRGCRALLNTLLKEEL